MPIPSETARASLPARWPRTSARATSPPRRPCRRMPVGGPGSSRSSPASSSASRSSRRRCASAASSTSTSSWSRGSGARTCRPRSRSRPARRGRCSPAERTALNFLGHLSGVATLTARFVEAVAGTGARILDTRKTTPGLRALEKAAVAAGGGRNHRMGLYDAILIKENHIALAGGVAKAVHAARTARPDLAVEVECRDLDEVAYASGPAPICCCSTTWTRGPAQGGRAARRVDRGEQGPIAGGIGRRRPGDGAPDRRDRRRLHLHRRPNPLGPNPRLQPPARAASDGASLLQQVARGGGL